MQANGINAALYMMIGMKRLIGSMSVHVSHCLQRERPVLTPTLSSLSAKSDKIIYERVNIR